MYIISFLLFIPITVYLNDIAEGGFMYKTTFSELLHEPPFWLSLLITCAIVTLPYYIVHVIWYVILYPEFNE